MEPFMFPDEWPLIYELSSNLPPNSKIVEWGCGGSTIKFCESLRDDQTIISIEHNREWFEKVLNELGTKQKSNWRLYYKPANDLWPHETHTLADDLPIGLDEYLYPGDYVLDGDLYLIDGICRATVALILLAKAKNRDAIVLIHDYTFRQHYYEWAVKLFPRSERIGTSLLKLYLR